MKKLKKSVKAIIISSVAILCVIAIVLGCVFGLKKPDDNPQNPSSPYGYTYAQGKLADEINKAVLKNKTTYQIYDNGILTNFNASVSSNNIIEFKSNYFVYADGSNNEHLVLYRKKSNGSYEYKELTAGLSGEFYVKTNSTNYAVITKSLDLGFYGFSVIYFGNFDNVVEIMNVESKFDCFINKDYVFLNDVYFAYYDFGLINTDTSIFTDVFNIHAFALKKTPLSLQEKNSEDSVISEVETFVNLVAKEEFNIVAENSKGVNVLSFDDGKTSKTVIDLAEFFETDVNSLVYRTIYAGKNAIILEKRNYVKDEDVSWSDVRVDGFYFNYSYKFLTFENGGFISKNLSLGDYSKIDVPSQALSNLTESFVVYRQKVNDNHNLTDNYLCTYYDRNLNTILEFTCKEQDRILFTGEGGFLTQNRLIATRRNMTVVTRHEFVNSMEENGYELYSSDVKNSVFIIRANGGLYGLMDFNGNVLVDPFEFNFKAISLNNDFAFGVYTTEVVNDDGTHSILEEYCIFNIRQKTFAKLNIDDSENYFNLLKNGFEGYFVYDEVSDTHNLYSFSGGIILDKIQDVDFYSKNIGAILDVYDESKTSSIVIESKNTFVFDEQNEIENYSFSISENKNYITLRIDGDNGLFNGTYDESDPDKRSPYRGKYFTSLNVTFKAFGSNVLVVNLTNGNSVSYDIQTTRSDNNIKSPIYHYTYNTKYGFVEIRIPVDSKIAGIIDSYVVDNASSEYYKYEVNLKTYLQEDSTNYPSTNPSNWTTVQTIYKWWYQGYSSSSTSFIACNTTKPETKLPGSSYLGYFDGVNSYNIQCATELGVISRDANSNINEVWYALFSSATNKMKYDLGYDNPEYVKTLPTIVDYNSLFYVPIPVRKGYIFKGWTITGMCSNHHHYFSSDPDELKGEIIDDSEAKNYGINNYNDAFFLKLNNGKFFINEDYKGTYNNDNFTGKLYFGSSGSSYAVNKASKHTTDSYVTYFRSLMHSVGSTINFKANWEEIPDGYKVQYVFADNDGNQNNTNQIAIYNQETGGITYKSNNNFEGYVINDNEAKYIIRNPNNGGNEGSKIYWTTSETAFAYPENFQTILVNQVFVDSNLINDAKTLMQFYVDGDIRLNENIFLDPANYFVYGWYYKDKEGGIHRLNDPEDNTKLKDTEGLLGSIDNIGEARFKLYAYMVERDFWLDYAWDENGGSAVDGENDINTSHKDNIYNVKIENVYIDENDTINDEKSFSKEYSNGQLGINTDMFNFIWADRDRYELKMTISVPYPQYLMDSITLQHFPCKIADYNVNNYVTKDVVFNFDWAEDGSLNDITSDTARKSADGYYFADSKDNGKNKIYISGTVDKDGKVCEVVVTIKNIDYTSRKKKGVNEISSSIISNSTVDYFGTYGFIIKGNARSNYENNDNVSEQNEINFGSISANDGYSKYYALPVSGDKIWLNGKPYTLTLSEGKNDYTIDGKKVYYNGKYLYYRAEDFEVNYQNTQIIAISPEQSKVFTSEKNSGFLSTADEYSFYELSSYLSKIEFRNDSLSASKNFYFSQPSRTLSKVLDKNNYGALSFEYSNLGEELKAYSQKSYDGSSSAINYFGTNYSKICGFELEFGNCKFDLILAYNPVDNHVMYFLISEGRLDGNDISFEFSDFDNQLSISQALNADSFDGNPTFGVESSFISNGDSWTDANFINDSLFVNNIAPSDSYIFKFTPQQGYLINSLVVRIGDEEIINFSLNKNDFDIEYTSDGVIQFDHGSGSERRNHITYAGQYNELVSYKKSGISANANWGIYFGNAKDVNWQGKNAEFETLYLLVGGAYDDVSIDIETISYFEFEIEDSGNMLGLNNVIKDENGKVFSLNNSLLSILKNSGGNWAELSDLSDLGLYIKYKQITNSGFYRLIFFGMASEFANGLALYASAENYSYYFEGAKLYGQSQTVTLIGSNNVSEHSLSVVGNLDKIIYLETDAINKLFINENFESNSHIQVNKFTLYLKVQKNNYSFSSNSYLFNNNLISGNRENGGYQASELENSSINSVNKINTEIFGNIVRKGDIYYQLDNNNTKTGSWFNDTTLSNIDYFYNNQSKNWQNMPAGMLISNINGYGLHIKYYEIPGYFLEYIDFNFSTTASNGGEVNNWVYLDMVKYAQSSGVFTINGTYITYSVNYNAADGYFDIYLYNNSENASYEDKIASLGILAGNVKVNFFARAREIEINLDSNVGASVSSVNSLAQNKNSISLFYDSLANLDAYLSMEGYTFVGWGSKEYFDDDGNLHERFTHGDGTAPNVWNSSSKWVNISDYFIKDNILRLKALNSAAMRSSDFYVAGGYFITDTGFKSKDRSSQIQSYNFWSAYAETFMDSYGKNNNADYRYEIDLYGIWKANTYNVILNLNDANAFLKNDSVNKNGSTVSFFKHNLYAFDTSVVNNGVVGIGELLYKAGESANQKYHLFVTYDTNDWYVLVDAENGYSHDNAATYVQSLKDYIIDRYGYTWLGWFAEQLENYKETLNNKDFGTLAVAKTDKFVAGAWAESLPALSQVNFAKFTTKTDDIDVTQTINNSHSVYNGKVVATFIYKNELGAYNNLSNKYDYFYSYNDVNKQINNFNVYVAEDYLNNYVKSRYGSRDNPDLRYFDTSKDPVKTGNTRDITIFAYWETNYYDVVVDFRDHSSPTNSLTGIGSSSVSLGANYVFEKVYFDDQTLISRLNKFLPVRLGYDFIGWSFDPQIAGTSGSILEYVFSRAGKYLLDNDITSLLFAELGAREDLLADSKEKLGDSESSHYVYMFAGWTAQTYNVNVSLNISKEGLENLYRADSEFALALYGSVYSEYSGIRQGFAMKNKNEFVDIVANISFEIVYDTKLSEARFVINSKNGGEPVSYSFDKLFATSAGYYLIGWLFNPDDMDSLFVSNTLHSIFDKDGNLEFDAEGESYFVNEMDMQVFDEDFFNTLYHSAYGYDNASKDKLSDIDFSSIMNANVVRNAGGKNYFDSFTYSSNESTNFGFVTIDGKRYYLATERIDTKFYMYYYNQDGIKQYVQPFIEVDSRVQLANGLNSLFTFNASSFYYQNYIIYFDDSEEGFNAYYVSGDYDTRTKLDIKLVNISSIADSEIEGKTELEYFAIKTREFTIYAHWFKKNDLSVVVNNGNNVGTNSGSNNGLAGYYEIENSKAEVTPDGNSEKDEAQYISVKTNNESDTKVSLGEFNIYDNIKLDILPYFNGRYLSEMIFKFYSYEEDESSYNENGIISSFNKVLYALTLKFDFDNEKRIPVINTEKSSASRDGMKISGVEFKQNEDGILVISGLSKLSIVDINAFDENSANAGFMKIDPYCDVEELDRLDINPIHFLMEKVKSSIDITCKFSIQTFDVDFYNVYDNNGFSLASMGVAADGDYTVGSYNSLKSLLTAVDSARYADGKSNLGVVLNEGDIIDLSKTDKLATISSDCASMASTYNVPYGFFIYGNNQFDSPISAENGMGRETFGGYDFIYQYGYYNFGSTETPLNSENYQASPLLGAPGLFGESIRKTSNLYTFVSWFEAGEKNGTFILNEYSEEDENTYISRNMSLIGYYYANNKPTNIQFYTWDDSTGSYTIYTQNIDEYTLQSSNSSSSFTESSTTIIEASENGTMFADERGRAIIKSNKSYGVDAVGFSVDNYTSGYIGNDALGNNFGFVNSTLVRNYWYYRYQNYYLYFSDGGVDHYIRYDQVANRFYYLEDEDNSLGTKHYINIYSTDIKDPSFVVYADLNPDTSGVVINNELDLEKYISESSALTRLSVDSTEYIYNLDGSRMYAYFAENYYEIMETRNFASDDRLTADEKTLVSKLIPNAIGTNVSAKYYVKLAGKIYFMITSDGVSDSENLADKLYEYSENEMGVGEFALADINSDAAIVNLDNYYLMVDEDFYKVEFGSDIDEFGTKFINPYKYVNTCVVPVNSNGVKIEITLYFDYESKQFYIKYEDGEYKDLFTDDIIPSSRVYTPVNTNYNVSILFNDETNKWEYECVKIKSLPSPNIGFWYNNNSYSYIGYIKMLESDIDYLVDKSINGNDINGNPMDPNKEEHKDRIYDTLYKYINTVYADLSDAEREDLQNQAIDYVNAYKNGKYYLKSIITVSKDGYIYKEGTNIIEYIDALITCVVPITINGVQDTINTTVKYRFSMIDSETAINDRIHAIPIYNANVIEYTSASIKTSGTQVKVDISKMYVQYFETIENLYTQMYGVKYGDYLKFAVLNETQFNSMIKSKNYPSELSSLMSDSRYGIWSESNPDGIRVFDEANFVSEVSGQFVWDLMPIDFDTYLDGKYYIVAYYNKSGQNYPVRVADNTICVNKASGTILTTIVSTKSQNNTLSI